MKSYIQNLIPAIAKEFDADAEMPYENQQDL